MGFCPSMNWCRISSILPYVVIQQETTPIDVHRTRPASPTPSWRRLHRQSVAALRAETRLSSPDDWHRGCVKIIGSVPYVQYIHYCKYYIIAHIDTSLYYVIPLSTSDFFQIQCLDMLDMNLRPALSFQHDVSWAFRRPNCTTATGSPPLLALANQLTLLGRSDSILWNNEVEQLNIPWTSQKLDQIKVFLTGIFFDDVNYETIPCQFGLRYDHPSLQEKGMG